MNPYQTLGIDRDATDEVIKNAYRQLAEKYGADNYAGSPLSDLAQSKMQEINDAYDQIMAERRVGGNANQTSSNSYSAPEQSYTQPNTAYAPFDSMEVRNLINANRIDEAENRLLQVPNANRNAEWNFLMGSVNYTRGWLDEADRYFSIASSMEPGNREYAAAFNRARNNRGGRAAGNPYGGYNTRPTSGGCSGCDICSGLLCADCCCECMGGDLIRCC